MKLFFRIYLLSFLAFFNAFAGENTPVVNWNSKEGVQMFERSEFKNDFYQLVNHFQPQINPLYCGPASSVIILNAIAGNAKGPNQKDLEVRKPKAFGGGIINFPSYSQLTFLNEETDKIKDRNLIELKNISSVNESLAENFDPGLTLHQLKEILSKTYGLKVKEFHTTKINGKVIDQFRNLVKQVFVDNDQFLIVNFHGGFLGQTTGGHISPIVAFDEKSDSILILDVAGHKNGWYWTKVTDLVRAMNTRDGEGYRGYLLVSDK